MPVVIRDGGKMWNKEDALEDTVAAIPDRCYATIYQAVIEDCTKHGPSSIRRPWAACPTSGSWRRRLKSTVPTTRRLFAHRQRRDSHRDGGRIPLEQSVERGDIFRACQTKDEAIRDWVKV